MGWTPYSYGGKQNTKGTLLWGAGKRSRGGHHKRYKDVLKYNLKACGIPIETWERQAFNRPEWCTACCVGVDRFEHRRIELQETRIARHVAQNQPHVLVKVANSENWGPLSEMSLSGMPCRAN